MLSFTALAEPTRFQIVEMLAKNGRMPAGQIYKRFSASPPAISQHLKVLKEAKLVQVEVNAQQRIYQLDPAGMIEIETWLTRMRRMWEQRFDALDDVVRKEMAKTNSKPKGEKK